jgi:dTDP-4-dehydrorhamnose reductase
VLKRLLAQEVDYLVKCIGLLVAANELDHARAIEGNSYLPHFLVALLPSCPLGMTRLIYLRTDCVFFGMNGPYTEKSVLNGVRFSLARRRLANPLMTGI